MNGTASLTIFFSLRATFENEGAKLQIEYLNSYDSARKIKP